MISDIQKVDISFLTMADYQENTEMILIADVDLYLLKELHNYGSVKNLKDRRTDLFELKRKILKH